MSGFKQAMGIACIICVITTSPAHAQIKHYPLHEAGQFSTHTGDSSNGTMDLYQQLKWLLGARVYGYLLENDQFLNFQELVLARLGEKYMVSQPPH